MAASHLADSGLGFDVLAGRVPTAALTMVEKMIVRGVNAPRTSSVGRLFDAVAALAGLRDRVSHEGQAAMELEWLASVVEPDGVYPFDVDGEPLVIDTRPLIAAVVRDVTAGVSAGRIGRRFHTTLVETIADICGRLRGQRGWTWSH
jgi:hydrogenase maturation protein HypF